MKRLRNGLGGDRTRERDQARQVVSNKTGANSDWLEPAMFVAPDRAQGALQIIARFLTGQEWVYALQFHAAAICRGRLGQASEKVPKSAKKRENGHFGTLTMGRYMQNMSE